MRLPGLGIVQRHGPDAEEVLRAEGDDQVPRGAPRRPAEVPRPAPAPLRRVRHAEVRDVLPVRPGLPDRVHRHGRHRHEGPLPHPLGRAGDVRRAARRVRPAPVRPAGPGPGVRPLRPDPSRGARGDPRPLRPRPEADARDPRGDPGGVRPPAGRGPEADQPEDRSLVRDDLRHRLVLPPPALRAARGGAARRGDRRARGPAARPRSSPGSTPPSPARRGPEAGRNHDAHDPPDAAVLAGDPAAARRARIRSISPPRARRGAFTGLERAIRDLGADGHDRDGRRVRACAAAAAPASRPPRSGGSPRTPRCRMSSPRARAAAIVDGRRVVVANGYGADPSSPDGPDAPRAEPVRASSRGR